MLHARSTYSIRQKCKRKVCNHARGSSPYRSHHTILEDVKVLAYNREFRSISGYYKGVKVIAISTGIGGSSASIAIEELKHIGVDTMIRIGSCGALQKKYPTWRFNLRCRCST